MDERFTREGHMQVAVERLEPVIDGDQAHDLLTMEAYRKAIKPVPRRVVRRANKAFAAACEAAGVEIDEASDQLRVLYRVAGVLWHNLDETQVRSYLLMAKGAK